MEEPSVDEQKLARDYLLGYLNEGERRSVEERLITDPEYLKEVLIVESELMEEHLDGVLPERDRKGFVKHVLATERQVEKLMIAKALSTSIRVDAAANSPPAAKGISHPFSLKRLLSNLFLMRGWGVRLAAFAVILIVVLGAWAVIRLLLNQSSRRGSLEHEVATLNTQEYLDAEGIFHGFMIGPLKAGLFRDDELVNKFVIPKTESLVQLRLQIGAGDYQTFRAILQTDENNEGLTINDIRDKRIDGERLVIVYFPAKVLPPGEYQLRLSGLTQNNRLEYIGRYTFRIVNK